LFTKRKIHRNYRPSSKELKRRCRQQKINRRKAIVESSRSVLKRKNKVKEGGTSRSRIKKE
jgi:hypothetical protein